jgi:hypothetical protein
MQLASQLVLQQPNLLRLDLLRLRHQRPDRHNLDPQPLRPLAPLLQGNPHHPHDRRDNHRLQPALLLQDNRHRQRALLDNHRQDRHPQDNLHLHHDPHLQDNHRKAHDHHSDQARLIAQDNHNNDRHHNKIDQGHRLRDHKIINDLIRLVLQDLAHLQIHLPRPRNPSRRHPHHPSPNRLHWVRI